MTAARVFRTAQLAVVAGFLLSCSKARSGATKPAESGQADGRGDAECAFTPCGGDLVGKWTIHRACLSSLSVANCPAAKLEPKNVNVSGNFSFGTDGVLAFDIRTKGTWEGAVPSSCLTGTDCKAIAETLYQENAPPATCTSDGKGGCNCSSPGTPAQTGSRRYAIAGSTAANMSFCVQNGVLKLKNESGTVFVSGR